MSGALNSTVESISARLEHLLGLSLNTILLLLLGLGASIAVFYKPLRNAEEKKQANGNAQESDANKHRQPGEWIPVKFVYPPVEACTERLAERKPIPYRPFRWGAYQSVFPLVSMNYFVESRISSVNMGIRNMPWNDWIELDKDHAVYHRIKVHRVQTRGQAAVRVLTDDANPGVVKGGEEAAIELVHELAEYLSRRYPKDFEVIRYSERLIDRDGAYCDWGWEDLPAIRTIKITSLDASYELPLSTNDGDRAPEKAMEIAGLLIQDDLALMLEGVDGKYYFQAGSICLPDKERLDLSLERFFRRLPVEKPVVRNNYFFQTNVPQKEERIDAEELAWAESTVGPEESFGHGTAFKRENGAGQGETEVEWIRFRSERQTLRRLPQSGAVAFTIRTYLTPVKEIAREKGVAGRLASALRSWPADVGEYKGRERGGWFEPLLEYLDECETRVDG
ncbi:hypothetical protein JR316_0004979 [Psilocybe cubensis]|uniref:Uncharacterized protein n=2 Tax=Psilocybe cubensis TaxID=181762 RepID=A0A8H8CLW8_PSICU|nr:hypothetical protein JR316_0004979 [Psilocybe cubensis]KAH9482879.1 hypothetical protein JR316_0004979 [Psilocybe cubensis]